MTSPSKSTKNTCMQTSVLRPAEARMWPKIKWFLHHITLKSSRILDWMNRTHKTVYLLSKTLRFTAFSMTPASHGYNHKAGLLYREWVTLDWHKHKWRQSHENAWCKGEIIEFAKHVSHQNFKHLQLETDIHEKGSWQNSSVLPTWRLNYVN